MKSRPEYNAGDEAQVEKQEEQNKNERDQELEDIKTLLATPAGLRFFRRMMSDGMMFTTTFRPNSNSAFLEGHRNLVLKYFSDICEAAPSKIPDLVIQPTE